ncbi:MAG: hypothetical protein ILA25_05010 [Prevotella sp.]|nr:hypothetical protein [Prevotella sp.]
MQQISDILRGRSWLMLLALLIWLAPQRASATYVDDKSNYSVSLGGSNIVYFEAPVYDTDGADTWIEEGKLLVSVDGGSAYTVFTWKSETNIDNDHTELACEFNTTTEGFFDITLGNTRNTYRLTKHNGGNRSLVRNSDNKTFSFSAEWVVPYNLLGKKLVFSWDVTRNGNSRTKEKVSGLNPKTINMPAPSAKLQPVVSAAMINPKNPSKLELPWYLASDSITSAYYEYYDASNKYQKEIISNTNSGVIMLDANQPHRNFRLVASYKERGDKGSYLIENQGSTKQNVSVIHAPIGLTATPLGDRKGKVELKWSVPYVDDEDITPTDFFEIQRSITGKEKDFVTIHQEFFSKTTKKSSYTFVDSTLIEALTSSMLKNGGTLDSLTYRVRRTITQDWGWKDNNCATSTRCIVDNLHLLRIASYTAKWEDERAYSVRVAWQYADEYNAIWDERAQMVLRVVSKNKAGHVVDSLTYVLDQNERNQRYKIVNLTRSCVTYDIDMYVERGESPINFVDQVSSYYYPIRSASDWRTFISLVENANGKDVNARLYADISTSTLASDAVGRENAPYRGVFDGNGHTLTVNYRNSPGHLAPFRYVGNATIRNLHTAGTITTDGKFAAGLIVEMLAGSTVNIENCRSSVTINSSVNGEATNGGFIASMNGNVVIRNSKFDGSFEGTSSSHNGGFVGWVNGGSNLIIENSVFAPEHITTKSGGCQTWARMAEGNVKSSFVNCHATRQYSSYIVIRNSDDWSKFRTMVEEAKNQYDVDAVLDADITVSDYVGGGEAAFYRGIFDGNGHTITFNKSGFTDNYLGLFRYTGNATIKNLHVRGTIKTTGQYTGGLIGNAFDGYQVNIENCRSSVTINSTKFTNGGFISRLGERSTATIRNSKFDGSFEGAESHHNGGFIGYCQDNSTATIENCLFEPDHLDTKFDNCETWARKSESAVVTVKNSHAMSYYSPSGIIIRSDSDWDKFVQLVKDAKNKYYVDAILRADISVKKSVGFMDAPWWGTLNGNGHTINIDIDSGDNAYAALFPVVWHATINDLHVTGKVNGGMYSAGLIGGAYGTPTITLNRVWVSVETTSNRTHAGGIIGYSNNALVNMNDCLFDGKANTNNADNSYAGEIIGWSNGGSWFLKRVYDNGWPKAHWMFFCLDNGSSWGTNNGSYTVTRHGWSNVDQHNKSDQSEVVNLMNGRQAGTWHLVDNKAVPVMNSTKALTAAELVDTLGGKDVWQVVDGKVVPVMRTTVQETADNFYNKLGDTWKKEGYNIVPATTRMAEPNYATITKPTLPDFYHENTGTIEKQLMTTTRQSSVLLSWNTDGNPIDYFKVMRRNEGGSDNDWKEIATNLDQLSYEDATVSPLLKYEYKVLAVNDCEGISTTETDVRLGECKHTGRVEGYVRFNDGTGAPNIQVEIIANGDTVKVHTDESGFFEADELSYHNKTDITYNVSTVVRGGIEVMPTSASATFDAHSNNVTLREFTIQNGKRFSGYVMYDGTSIPVKGANFKVDGQTIHTNTGDIYESDHDGSFSFRMLPGEHTIQVAMPGHTFTGDGYYKNKNMQNINDDIAGTYFYDATKVKLAGRVVGGNDQGRMPLDNNLSTNNLGDSLTMVLTLEGDNTSWLVFDNLNPNRTRRDTTYVHPRGNGHKTEVTTERKRMVVQPDPKTGEYMLMLPPVRWKVQQVYCKGYPTLFQEGQVSEVVDLTDCLTRRDTTYAGNYKDVDSKMVENPKASYNAVYNRIYHSPVEVIYKQLTYDTFDYLGDKFYMATDLKGDGRQVPLAYRNPKDTTKALYSFGYPVFSMERKYRIQVQVAERYPYNNSTRYEKVDMVRLGGGYAYMQNGMKAGAAKEPLQLDSLGQAIFTLQADQTTKLLTGEDALKTVTFTVERDGTTFEAKPLRGYVLNMFPIGKSQDIMAEGKPILFDILRDPPGAASSSTLAKGATLNHTYTMSLTISAGPLFTYKYGEKMQTVSASVVAPNGIGTAVGPISAADTSDGELGEFKYDANGTKAFSYSMNVSHNISTSGDPSMVGADADLYIGTVQNAVVTPMSTIRAVTDSMWNEIKARAVQDKMVSEVGKELSSGSVVYIAGGKNEKGDTLHLIRDVALGYGPKVQSQFVYSQKQLLEQIIPDKAREIVDMMYLGTKEQAQAIADKTQQPVYLSLRQPTDSAFAVANRMVEDHAYNTTIDKAEKRINYLVVLPTGKTEQDFSDEVLEKYQTIKAWMEMISQNEGEKLNANNLLANYDIAGAQGVNYSETFDTNFTNTWGHHFPIADEADYFGPGSSHVAAAGSIGLTIASGILLSLAEMKTYTTPSVSGMSYNADPGYGYKSSVTFAGKMFQWTLAPVVAYSTIGNNANTKAYNRTTSFTIAADPSSRLNVDVYRVSASTGDATATVRADNVFTNDNFNNLYDEVIKQVGKEVKADQIMGPRGFVFRTRGGATQNPWEDERKTHFYDPGTVLDARTLKINNPTIRLDKQSVSGVSISDAARFTIYLANESEKPDMADKPGAFTLFAVDQANPHGAKLTVDGQPLTTGGMSVTIMPGVTTQLQLEVRAGQGFDYEGLTIGVMSPTDAANAVDRTSFDVHFLREAGGATISAPGDKWVLNTEAQKDSKRGWYIPVTINGFDRHQHNFDHIEFQYKESQRGDDAWTNACSFYADSTLMAKANGVRKLMKENENIVTEFYGEGWETEKSYDLRAVVFCRNGSEFLTTSSKIVSGIKDTRRPQLFGTPEPKSGILTPADDIVFNFSEDIEYNNLSAITNFEVRGEVNNSDLSTNVSVQFTGKSSVETEAKRNFSGKDVTIDLMVRPDTTARRDMPLFSHGTNGQTLQLWVTKDFKLKAVVNKQEFVSDSTIAKSSFTQVAMVLNQTDNTVTFYNGGVQLGKVHHLTASYTGTGPLIYGRTNDIDRNASQFYQGRMMECRLWYSAMSGGLIGTTYGYRRLSGYEKDLVDYYPMNEGSGKYVVDRTQGADAQLIEANWAIPHGYSLRLEKETKGVRLTQDALNRTNNQDYTLMFWFKTDADGRGTLLSNGRGLKQDNGAEHQFHIGFEDEKLMYRSNGFAAEVEGKWSDNQWHHYAMTVNRGRNEVNIYVDKEQRATFAADSLGGISGGYPMIGGSRYDMLNEKDSLETHDGTTPLKGNIDELLFFEQALPPTLINTYSTKSPQGDEYGLMTFLGFERQERQKNNDIETVPYLYSKKIYLDDKREVRYQVDSISRQPTGIPVRDYVFVDGTSVVERYVDNTQAAPVVPYEEVKNLKFSYIGRGNQLLVDLDEPGARLNRRHVYVTVRDVEDKNGNRMASPKTACYLVYNSSLEWLVNKVDHTVKYGSGEQIEMPFYNNSAVNHTYKIENCPKWLTLNSYSDVVAPQSLGAIVATVNKDLSIGSYSEIIYLTDEEGITEPLYLNLTVEGDKPSWANGIDKALLDYSMSISGQVYLYNQLDTDARDIVGAFDSQNVCHGYANISYSPETNESAVYLTVYDSIPNGRDLKFRLWQYSTGREIVLTATPAVKFSESAVLGTDTPVRFEGGDNCVQNFRLKQGWNWVSFNVTSSQQNKLTSLLSSMPWKEGDVLSILGSNLTMSYKDGKWMASGRAQDVPISSKNAYAIKVQEDCVLPVEGTVITDVSERTITVKKGWNGIGYTPTVSLSVDAALTDYFDEAEQGDVIKSHTEFAYFTKSGNTGQWRGSLQYMKPGEGYMMLRKGTSEVSFVYPYYDLSSYREAWSQGTVGKAALKRSTMSVSAHVVGVDVEDGDMLMAYSNGELVGEGVLTTTGEPAYMSIAGDTQQPIWFAVEREGEIVASTGEVMTFKADAVIGSPDEPTAINFVRADAEVGKWYTVDGLMLQEKPVRKGVYIYNGKKIVVR